MEVRDKKCRPASRLNPLADDRIVHLIRIQQLPSAPDMDSYLVPSGLAVVEANFATYFLVSNL